MKIDITDEEKAAIGNAIATIEIRRDQWTTMMHGEDCSEVLKDIIESCYDERRSMVDLHQKHADVLQAIYDRARTIIEAAVPEPNVAVIWDALYDYRESEQWDAMCMAMTQLLQAAGLPAGRHTPEFILVCPDCGSEDHLCSDAVAHWDPKAGGWRASECYDKDKWCNMEGCPSEGEPIRIEERKPTGCNFTWKERDDGSIYIEDLCASMGGMSVTNGAEKVLAEIARHIDIGGRIVVYKDTEGQVDQLRQDNGRFIDFQPGDPCAKPKGPECGHSSCSQHYIDTGETECLKGYAVFDADGFFQIQRIDEMGIFDNDDDAIVACLNDAFAGDKTAQEMVRWATTQIPPEVENHPEYGIPNCGDCGATASRDDIGTTCRECGRGTIDSVTAARS